MVLKLRDNAAEPLASSVRPLAFPRLGGRGSPVSRRRRPLRLPLDSAFESA